MREPQAETIGTRVVSGSVWVLIGFAANALVNLARTVILARALSVESYGVAAAILVVSRLLGGLGTMGLEAAAIQMKREPDALVLDTVFTVDRLLVKLVQAVAVFAFAPAIASFFGADELVAPLRGLALLPIVMGFENNASVVLARKLEMRRRIRLDLATAFGGAVVIPAALVYPSPWVVVVSLLVGRLTRTIASYVIHPVLPRLRIDRAALAELFPFGRFVFLQNLVLITRDQLDKLLIAALLGTASLGIFELGQRLGAQIIAIVDNLALKVLFPVFARSQDTPELGVHRYLTTLEVLAIMVLPTAAVLTLGADLIMPLLFRHGWDAAVPAVQLLSLAAAIRVLSGASRPLIRGFGRSGVDLTLDLALFASIALFVATLAPWLGVLGAVYAVFAAYLLQVPLSLVATRACLGVRPAEVLGAVARPALATGVASMAAFAARHPLGGRGPLIELAVLAATFAVVYLGVLVPLEKHADSARLRDVEAALRASIARMRRRR